MSSYCEWELMEISEEIEPGDTIAVENEDGDSVDMLFIKHVKKVVKLMDEHGDTHQFNPESLEEIGGYCVITGKSENKLSIKEVLKKKKDGNH